jgi:hypothetical protein
MIHSKSYTFIFVCLVQLNWDSAQSLTLWHSNCFSYSESTEYWNGLTSNIADSWNSSDTSDLPWTKYTHWLISFNTVLELTEWSLRSKLPYIQWSVGQSVLVSGMHNQFYFLFHRNYFLIFLVLLVCGTRFWREDWSVIYSHNCYLALPAVSLSDSSPAELETISYCLIWDWVPFLFPFHLLQLAGLHWRCSNLPPHGNACVSCITPRWHH